MGFVDDLSVFFQEDTLMPHDLEIEYGLSAGEILDAINKRFRAKVTLEGAVAEVMLGQQIRELESRKIILKFQELDEDGKPDYNIWLPSDPQKFYRVECKNVRNSNEAFRTKGQIVAYKVETQKTRASKGDKSSRFYAFDQFEIVAVCLGKKTKNWKEFLFIKTKHLSPHKEFSEKLATIQRVPLPNFVSPPWYNSLESLLRNIND